MTSTSPSSCLSRPLGGAGAAERFKRASAPASLRWNGSVLSAPYGSSPFCRQSCALGAGHQRSPLRRRDKEGRDGFVPQRPWPCARPEGSYGLSRPEPADGCQPRLPSESSAHGQVACAIVALVLHKAPSLWLKGLWCHLAPWPEVLQGSDEWSLSYPSVLQTSHILRYFPFHHNHLSVLLGM